MDPGIELFCQNCGSTMHSTAFCIMICQNFQEDDGESESEERGESSDKKRMEREEEERKNELDQEMKSDDEDDEDGQIKIKSSDFIKQGSQWSAREKQKKQKRKKIDLCTDNF